MTREELNKKKQKEIFKEENKEKRKKIAVKTFKFLLILCIGFFLFYLYNTYISTGTYIFKEIRIVNAKVPETFNGLKIIQFSDMHYGNNINYEKLKEIVNSINKRNPDIVIYTGDLLSKDYTLENNEQEKIISQLKKIRSNLGKYAVIGDQDKDNYSTIMNQSEFIVLNNDYDLIYGKTNDAILISGFGSKINNEVNINKGLAYFDEEASNSNIFSIGAFHEPDLADDILNNRKIDLLLAGHSHNGNIRIPFIGSLIKKEGAKKYDQEYYDLNESKLYISSGLGTEGEGIRLFCKPSINFFRISNS